MRIPVNLDCVDTIDPAGVNTTLFAMRSGEDWSLQLSWVASDGITPEDLTGRTFTLRIGSISSGYINSIVFSGTSVDAFGQSGNPTVWVPSPTTGVMNLSIAAAQTTKLSPGTYKWVVLDTTSGKNESMIEGAYAITAGLGK